MHDPIALIPKFILNTVEAWADWSDEIEIISEMKMDGFYRCDGCPDVQVLNECQKGHVGPGITSERGSFSNGRIVE